MTVATAGETITVDAAMAATVMVAVASRPSAAANTSAVPGPTALTTPSAETDTTLGAPDVQVTARCASTFPPASSATTARRRDPPTINAPVDGSTRSVAMGDGATVTVAVPLLPSLVTVIVAVPGADTVTVPSADTCATFTLLLLKLIGRPVNRLPLPSVICTVKRTDCPTVSADCAGDTMTAPTGRGRTVMFVVAERAPLLAVIIAEPLAMPSTSPDDDTEAIPPALVLNVTKSSSRAPVESRGVAVSCVA